MKLHTMKVLAVALITGGFMTVSITTFGIALGTPKVEALLQDEQVNIIVNGKTLELEGGSHILNFNGRIHTPVRAVAESLGARVHWDEASKTIIITGPAPQITGSPVPPETPPPTGITAPENEPPARRRYYSPLPLRRALRDISVNITSMEFYPSQTEVILDFESRSQWPLMFLESQTFIEFRGERFPVADNFTRLFKDSLPGRYRRYDMRIIFAPLPQEIIRSGAEVDEIRVVIAVKVIESVFLSDPSLLALFEFNIDPSDEPFFNLRQ